MFVSGPMSSEDAQTLTDVKQLVSKLYSTLNVETYQLEQEKIILARLEDLNEKIAPLEKVIFLLLSVSLYLPSLIIDKRGIIKS